MTAQIIPMPGALSEPVQQKRGPGRWPAHIVNMHFWRLHNKLPNIHLIELEKECEHASSLVENSKKYYDFARINYAETKQRFEQEKNSNPKWSKK